jgi:hypothetical protein
MVLEQIHALLGETLSPRKLKIIDCGQRKRPTGMENGCEYNK